MVADRSQTIERGAFAPISIVPVLMLPTESSTADLTDDLPENEQLQVAPSGPTEPGLSAYGGAMFVGWTVAASGASAFMLALTTFVSTLFHLLLGWVGLVDANSPTLLSRWVPWLAALAPMFVGLVWVLPTLGRLAGIPLRQTVPRRTRRYWRIRSLEDHQLTLRIVLLAFVMLPLATLLAYYLIPNPVLPLTDLSWWGNVIVSAAFFGLGLFLYFWTPGAYRRSRRSRIRRSLRFYHRGVAIRSYIAEWDNPKRPIYKTCRISRRIANLHRATTFSIMACWVAASCIAARLPWPGYVNEIIVLLPIAALIPLWPLAKRIVHYSAVVIDPFCRDREEYVVYD